MNRTLITLLSLLLAISSYGCKRKRAEVSETKHEIGSLPRDRGDNFKGCNEVLQDGKLGKIQRYLKKVFKELTERNKDIFKDDYSPDNFCIQVRDDDSFNASAVSRTGRISVNTGMIDKVDSSLEVAFVMAHEASHILAQHNKDLVHEKVDQDSKIQALREKRTYHKEAQRASHGEIENLKLAVTIQLFRFVLEVASPIASQIKMDSYERSKFLSILEYLRQQPQLETEHFRYITKKSAWFYSDDIIEKNREAFAAYKDAPRYQLMIEQYEVSQRELKMHSDFINQHSSAYRQVLKDLEARSIEILGGHEGALLNWMEEEADDLALEIMLRAGLEPFEHSFRNFSDLSDDCYDQVKRGIEPERGSDTHPQVCWRVYNILQQA